MLYRLNFLLFFLLLTIGVAYGQDSLSQRITQQSLENALNEGFMISKVNNIAFAIGGYVQTNVVHDFYRIGSDADFHPSRIGVPTERYPYTHFNVRDSRLRVSTKSTRDDAPPFLILLEVDFMNDHGAPRIRHAWFEYGNFAMGQYWSNFMDHSVFPNVAPDALLNSRRIQLRYSHQFQQTQLSVALEDSPPDATVPDGWEARQVYPAASAAVRQDVGDSYLRLGLLLNPLSYHNATDSATLHTTTGLALNLSGQWSVPTGSVKGQVTYGNGYGSYLKGLADRGYEARAVGDRLATIDLLTCWLFYDHYWNDRWASTVGYGVNMIGNRGAQTSSSVKQTRFGAANLQYQPFSHFRAGLEVNYGRRVNFASETATDNEGQAIRLEFTTVFVF